MKQIEHVLLHPICVLSPQMFVCQDCNIKLSWYCSTHWSCWSLKKNRFNAIFCN